MKPSSDSRSNAEKPPIPALAQTKTVAGRALAASAAPPRAAAPPKAAAAKAQSSKQLTKAKSVPSVGGATGEVANLKADLESSMEDNAELTKTVESLQAERNELRAANSELEAKHAGATDEVAAMKRSLKTEQAETARLKAEQKKQKAELQAATSELEAGRQKAEQEASELKAALAAAKEEARAREATLDELTERSRAQEELRRKMHETIQDLKGNIRVFCRVRGGAATKAGVAVRCPPTEDSSVVELLPPAALGKQPREGGMVRFQFDRVFDETTSQQDVFTEVSQLTQSALDGFKVRPSPRDPSPFAIAARATVFQTIALARSPSAPRRHPRPPSGPLAPQVCIFAYGQTGSGKTFTMDGPRNQGDEARGVVPRAAEQAFARAEELKSLGWEYSFELSCLEIYNEELRDMLNKGNDKLKVVDSGDKVRRPARCSRSGGPRTTDLLSREPPAVLAPSRWQCRASRR